MISGVSRADDNHPVVFDFDTPKEAQQWRPVNDGVMGGRSEGAFRVSQDGILEFYGNLSLENRGGFASVRSRTTELELPQAEALSIRVRGDGRSYYCNLYVPSNRIAYSYRAKIDTEAGRWQEVRLPLSAFRATWFGRTLSDAPEIDAENIRALGFMIADKKAGPFKLEVDWIRAAGKPASDPS
jgi:monofunctional biosynthetic peptidoglycan transglycosylase